MSTQEIVPRHRNRKKRHPLLIILSILLAMALIVAVLGTVYVLHLASTLPEITIEDLETAQTSYVLDEQGGRIASLHGGEKRIVVELDEVPQHLKDAIIASEDFRFYQHKGVDIRGIGRALVVDLKDTIANHSLTFTQGASTLTMQLVKNVVEETEKTLPRKIKQALLALEFEKHYSKDQILYYYINEIYLGPQVYG
ncbi:MAG: transglycosylase domain-containing protein, partial [Firmicutes bacterium]|nr:transglycosylase domain-containing protein [Bacillota bacterium]